MADWFVDLSAANNGDGTDGAQAGAPAGVGAWNVLTATELANVNPGDTVWIRRTDGSGGSKKTLAFKDGTLNNRIEFNGWPVDADDEHWVAAQASGNTVAATWNGDGSDWVVINPFGASANHQHRVYRRLYWDETASAANEPFHSSTGSQETRWHKCRARRATSNAPMACINGGSGRMEMDDIHVIGTGPNTGLTLGNAQISANGASGAGGSNLIRVRLTFTGAGAVAFYVNGAAREFLLEILEFNDSGAHWVRIGWSGIHVLGGGATESAMFTTDDDAVGMIPAGGSLRTGVGSNCGKLVLRNLDYDHANSPVAAATTFDVPDCRSLTFENIRFPAAATTHILMQEFRQPNALGRNLFIDTAKIVSNTGTDNATPSKQQLHVFQLNNTNAWFRFHQGIRAQTSNINRAGGHANGILVETLARDAGLDERGYRAHGVFAFERPGYEAMVFPRFGLGFPVTQTLTLYFATAFWDGREDKNNIWVEATAYRDATGFHRKIYDSRKLPGAVLIADGSTWNNITGHNAWRIELPIDLEQDDIVQVRFFVADTFRNGAAAQNVTIFDPALTLA